MMNVLPTLARRSVAVFTMILSSFLTGGPTSAAGPDARAQQLLADAQRALGSADAAAGLRSLTATGRFRRVIADLEMEGTFELAVQLPDRLLRTETLQLREYAVTRRLGISGNRLLRETRSPVDGSRLEPFVLPRDAAPVVTREAFEQGLVRLQRAELRRLALAWFAALPGDPGSEATYVGRADLPDGSAEAIDVRAPDDFQVRLFVDARTHRPRALTYQGVRLPGSRSPEAGTAVPASVEEFRLDLEDHRVVDGVVLPHRLTVSVGNDIVERWDVDAFRLRDPLAAETFEVRR